MKLREKVAMGGVVANTILVRPNNKIDDISWHNTKQLIRFYEFVSVLVNEIFV